MKYEKSKLFLTGDTQFMEINGEKVDINDIVFSGGTPIKKSESFLFEGEYYHKSMEKNIFIDVVTGRKAMQGGSTIKSFEDVDPRTGSVTEYGYTDHKSFLYVCYHKLLGKFYTSNSKGIIEKLKLKEHIASGAYTDNPGSVAFDPQHGYKFNFPPKELIDDNPFKYGVKSQTYRITNGLKNTFGIEIETCSGTLNGGTAKDLGVNGVYDGSIKNDNGEKVGVEYTTLPLTGDQGFVSVKRILNELIRTDHRLNKTCSVHVHIGGSDFSIRTTLALAKLCCMIEEEIYSVIPASRKTSTHCNPISFGRSLKSLEQLTSLSTKDELHAAYLDLKRIVGCDNSIVDVGKGRQHPLGPKCGWDHNTPRYWWVNFVPTMFNMRNNRVYTVEFRHHSATLNYRKIKMLVLLCIAITNAAENNWAEIFNSKNMTIKDVLRFSYGSRAPEMIEYFEERKRSFQVDPGDSKEYSVVNNRRTEGKSIKSAF